MKDDRILIILPTRGRPWSALEAVASVMKNVSKQGWTDIAIYQDKDASGLLNIFSDNVNSQKEIPERRRFCEIVNEPAKKYCHGGYDIFTWLGDDVRYLTPGWDDIVRSHKELVVYGPDGIQDKAIATHPFVSAAIPRALGYLVPPELKHYCADLFIHALGNELHSIAYDERLRIDHQHCNNGKRPMDKTHEEARQFWDADHKTWEAIKPTIPELARKVRAAMRQP